MSAPPTIHLPHLVTIPTSSSGPLWLGTDPSLGCNGAGRGLMGETGVMIPQCHRPPPPPPGVLVDCWSQSCPSLLEAQRGVGAPQSPFMVVAVTGWLCGSHSPGSWGSHVGLEASDLCFVASGVPEPLREKPRTRPLEEGGGGRQPVSKAQIGSPRLKPS